METSRTYTAPYFLWTCGVLIVQMMSALHSAQGVMTMPIQGGGQQEWFIVEDVSSFPPPDVELMQLGSPEPFQRDPPQSMDSTVLFDFFDTFNLLQDVSPIAGDNLYQPQSSQYVAEIPGACVEGEAGLVYDDRRNVFHEIDMFPGPSTGFVKPLPKADSCAAEVCDERYEELATVIQKHGHMYYHFLEETVPRLYLLQQAIAISPDAVKILMWAEPYELGLLERMGIPAEAVVKYNASKTYCADVLHFPSPTQQITPSREAILSIKKALAVPEASPADRDLVIFVSRSGASERRVQNEQEMVDAIKREFPAEKVVRFVAADVSLNDTIDLFSRAKVVLGPHGSGLANVVFSAPGTSLVEFQFMQDPPMMFWHTAAALQLDYWMLPVPNSHWLQDELEVPLDEVLDILSQLDCMKARPTPTADYSCPPGRHAFKAHDGHQECHRCQEGTYSFRANTTRHSCTPCPKGRYSSEKGSSACRTCPLGTFSEGGASACTPCPGGTASRLPGGTSVSACLSDAEHQSDMEDPAQALRALRKLSPTVRDATEGRLLIEADGSQKSVICLLPIVYSRTTYRSPYLPVCDGDYATVVTANDGPTEESGVFDTKSNSGDGLGGLDVSPGGSLSTTITIDDVEIEIDEVLSQADGAGAVNNSVVIKMPRDNAQQSSDGAIGVSADDTLDGAQDTTATVDEVETVTEPEAETIESDPSVPEESAEEEPTDGGEETFGPEDSGSSGLKTTVSVAVALVGAALLLSMA